MKILVQALLLSALVLIPARADDLVSNGGFENGTAGWSLFVPDESNDKNCRFDVVNDAPHSGASCLRLQSDDFARYSVGTSLVPVTPGDHYKVSVWIKAGPDAHVRLKAPGFAVRLFLAQNNTDAAGGHLFIAPGNRVTRNTPADPVADELPTAWTQIEAVIEIPPGVGRGGAEPVFVVEQRHDLRRRFFHRENRCLRARHRVLAKARRSFRTGRASRFCRGRLANHGQ